MATSKTSMQETVSVLRYDPQCDILNVTTTDDDVTQYLEDPALHHDFLPQPYRRVNKLLTEIVDGAWGIIAEHQEKIVHDASKIRPPQYDTASIIEELGSVSCLCSSPDSKCIFVGVSDGRLVCIDAAYQHIVAEWKPDDSISATNFIHCTATTVAEHIYVIATTDNTGSVRLFTYIMDVIFLVHTFYDGSDAGKKGLTVNQCVLPHSGDYVGLHVTETTQPPAATNTTVNPAATNTTVNPAATNNTVNPVAAAVNSDGAVQLPGVSWLEVHRLPREIWIKELDPVLQLVQRDSSVSMFETISASQLRSGLFSSHVVATSQLSANIPTRSVRGDDEPLTARNIPPIKLSAPILVLKVRPPNHPTGMTWSSPQQALKTVESGSYEQLIGTGLNHLVSKQHVEMRTAAFEHQHEKHVKLLHCEQLNDHIVNSAAATTGLATQPNFHFLLSLNPITTQQTPDEQTSPVVLPVESTSQVAVWWSGFSHVLLYNLNRSAKDLEAVHPDVVWPMSHCIVATAASDSKPLFAVALTNNDVLVFDRIIGCCLCVVKLNSNVSIHKIFFNIVANDTNDVRLFIQSSSGQIFIIPCLQQESALPQPVYVEVEDDEERPATVQTIHGMPQLLAVCREDGRLYLHDVVERKLLCEVVLPINDDQTVSYCPPLQPSSFVVADGGRILYAIAEYAKRTSELHVHDLEELIAEQSASLLSEPYAPNPEITLELDSTSNVALNAKPSQMSVAPSLQSKQSHTSVLPPSGSKHSLASASGAVLPSTSKVMQASASEAQLQGNVSDHSHTLTLGGTLSLDVSESVVSVVRLVPHLFVYKLLYFPTFDNYEFMRAEHRSAAAAKLLLPRGKSTVEARVNQALHARFAGQQERNERLQCRWTELKTLVSQCNTAAGDGTGGGTLGGTTGTSGTAAIQTKG